jgi:hypothetical protein
VAIPGIRHIALLAVVALGPLAEHLAPIPFGGLIWMNFKLQYDLAVGNEFILAIL